MLRRLRALAPFLVVLGLMIPPAYAADTITTNILITKQEAGGNLNTWGDIANANFQTIDNKFGSTTVVATTGGTTTLTSTQEIVQTIRVTGALVSNATLQFSCRGGYWAISNETSGAFTLTAKCSGQTGAAITQGGKLGVYSDGTDIRAIGAAGTKAVGEVFDYAGTTCPAQSIEPYGQSLNATTYSALFGVLGTIYGTSAGNVVLPDLRGRVVAGEDDMGGTSANRLTAAVSQSLDGDILGATGGEETHTPTLAEVFAHTHGQGGSFTSSTESVGHTHNEQGTFTSSGQSADHSHTYSGNVSFNDTNRVTSTSFATASNFNASGGTTAVTSASSTSNALSATYSGTTSGMSVSHSHNTTLSGSTANESATHTHSISLFGSTTGAGSSTAFNQVQPTIILHKCIYTGV